MFGSIGGIWEDGGGLVASLSPTNRKLGAFQSFQQSSATNMSGSAQKHFKPELHSTGSMQTGVSNTTQQKGQYDRPPCTFAMSGK